MVEKSGVEKFLLAFELNCLELKLINKKFTHIKSLIFKWMEPDLNGFFVHCILDIIHNLL